LRVTVFTGRIENYAKMMEHHHKEQHTAPQQE
jgi:hypothetical protein